MLEDRTIREIYAHAEATYPQECCGIVTAAGAVVPLQNAAKDPYNSFGFSATDYLKYSGGALFAYHSHPDRLAVASDADLEWAERCRLPLMIVSWPEGSIRMIGDPCQGSEMEGRPFIYGVYDCYSLVQDYYGRRVGVTLPTITRPRFGWWESGDLDPFAEGAACTNMVDVDSPEHGDVLLFSFHGSPITNHIGIYQDGDKVLHHRLLSLSTLSPYDAPYREATTRILRHVD